MDEGIELIQRYSRNGDQAAFAELVNRKAGLVYSVAIRQTSGDEHLAKDVTQKVFIALARKAAKLASYSTIDGWLYRAAFLTAADMIRGERRRRKRDEDAQVMENILMTAPYDRDWTGVRPALDGAINELEERERDAVLLRFYENRSYAEVGRVLNVSPDAARMRVERALEKMGASLTRQGMTSTTGALALVLETQATAALPVGLTTSVSGAALAAGASVGGAGMVLGLINSMNATKTGLGIAALVSLFGVSSAVYEGQSAQKAEASLAAAVKAHAADQAKIAELNRVAAADDQKWSELQKTVDQMRAAEEKARTAQAARAARTARASPNSPAGRAAALAAGQNFLAAYPQARAMLKEIGRAQIASIYAAFYRSANPKPAQIELLESRTEEQWMQTIVATPGRIVPGEPQLPDDQLREILGDKGFQQFQEFQRIQPVDGLLRQASILLPSEPITPAQSDQVMSIVANASASYQSGGKAKLNDIDWSQVMTQAQGVVSEAQVKALKAQGQFPPLFTLLAQYFKNNNTAN